MYGTSSTSVYYVICMLRRYVGRDNHLGMIGRPSVAQAAWNVWSGFGVTVGVIREGKWLCQGAEWTE